MIKRLWEITLTLRDNGYLAAYSPPGGLNKYGRYSGSPGEAVQSLLNRLEQEAENADEQLERFNITMGDSQ